MILKRVHHFPDIVRLCLNAAKAMDAIVTAPMTLTLRAR
jgi:hypothetical protein